jgi:tetratricopeptide (TPR) repeat protein
VSDETKKDDFDLDWDDALSDWEKDVEGDAVAKSGPMPQAPQPAKPPPSGARPLYQPPDASEIAKMRGRAAPAPAKPAPAPAPIQSHATKPPPPNDDPFGDDDDEGATRVANLSREMLEQINAGPGAKPAPAPAPNEPKPRSSRPEAAISAVDLDLDGLLDGLDGETQHYPAEIPRVVRPFKSVPPAAGAPTPVPAPASPLKPAPARPDAPQRNAATELARAVARSQPKVPIPAALRPMPSVPRPGGAPVVPPPKPGLPAVPRPLGVGVPKPGAIPKPGELAKPAPIVKPAEVAKPATVEAPKPVEDAKPTEPPKAEPAPTQAADDDFDMLLSGLDAPATAAPVAPAVAKTPTPVPAAPAVVAPPANELIAESEAEDAFFAVAEPRMSATPRSLEQELDDLALDEPAPSAPTPTAEPAAPTPATAAPATPAPATPAPDASSDDDAINFVTDDEPADDDLDALAPPAPEPAAPVAAAPVDETPVEEAPPPAPEPPKPTVDRGAQAARRSVRTRKPRKEHFPLVGHDENARRAQLELLARLAARGTGSTTARALATAADVANAIGDGPMAASLREKARAADPHDILTLRSTRRAAQMRAAWDEVRDLLRKEAELPGSSPALTYAALAELELGPRADEAAASEAASRALASAPTSISAALALHDAAEGAPTDAAFGALSTATLRTPLSALVDRLRARASERAGRPIDVSGDDVEALLVRARTAQAQGAAAPLAERLAALGGKLAPGELADASKRAAAIAWARAGDPARALDSLGHDGASVPTHRTTARLAARQGDRARETAALRAWAAATSGSDRASALARVADLAVDAGDLDQAEAALRDAALADASLGTLRIVRDRIVRKDPARAGRSDGSEGALALAAKVAIDLDDGGRELELLGRARTEEDAPVTADVLSLDAIAMAEASGGLAHVDYAPLDQALSREVERTPADARTPALLVLADRYASRNDDAAREQALRDARTLSPGEAVVVRDLAALLATRAPREAAALWLEEASAAPDARAAFAASMAGRLLEGDASVMAHRRALDALRTHAPSIEALERHARAVGDAKMLEEALERALELPTLPLDRAAQLVRLGLVRSEDGVAASKTFAEARALAPDDTVLVDLAMRLGDALTPAQRSELTGRAARSAPAGLGPAYALAHVLAIEDAGDAASAATAARALVDEPGVVGHLARRALDRIEIGLGDLPSVAERRFAVLRAVTPEDGSVGDEAARLDALEQLASFDLDVRRDASSAAASLSAITEIRPSHLFALRALERQTMEGGDGLALASLEERIARAELDSSDATAHLRLAVRLRLAPADARGDAADEAVLAARGVAPADVWTLRRVAAAAHARGDVGVAAETELAIARHLAEVVERGSYALRAATSLERSQVGIPTAPARGAELLAPFAAAAPTHGPLLEALAELQDRAGAHAAAVDALEAAARTSSVPARKLALFHRAAVIAADRADDEERALAMLEGASEIDVAYQDVFDRLRVILERKGDRAKLSDLVRRRAAAGGEGAMLVDLHLAEASLREQDGDAEGAKDALRAALALAPERVEALRKLAQLSLAGGDHRTAADALIRIARVRKDREELRWVFFTLGDIYDVHIPDAKRAEAAFLRVLKLDAEDLPSMERLAALYQREQQLPQAADMLDRLAKAEGDPDRVRKHQLALASVLESSGDARKAEQVLEIARRAGPTELETLRALADFYTRQRAQTAHAMHLNRAVADFRHALVNDLADTQAWLGLVEVLGWRGKRDAARVVASVATALGVVDPDLAKLLDARGGAPGAGLRGADADLDDALAPQTLTPSTRSVFRLLGAALEKVLPFDPRSLKAEKLGAKDTALRPIALEIGKWMGLSDVEIWLAPTGRVCMPISSQPVSLVVGRDLLTADERERAFLLARAIRVAKSNLTLAMRATPTELSALLSGLVLNFDPNHQPPAGVDPAAAQDFMKRVARQLPRRAQEEIGPHVFEMAGAVEYEPGKLPLAVSELGDRAALLMTGNAPAAFAALAKLAGEPAQQDPRARVAAIRRSPESASLASFALSDAHFEARSRAGLS